MVVQAVRGGRFAQRTCVCARSPWVCACVSIIIHIYAMCMHACMQWCIYEMLAYMDNHSTLAHAHSHVPTSSQHQNAYADCLCNAGATGRGSLFVVSVVCCARVLARAGICG